MKTPSVLAFTRSINPGHFLMYSAAEVNAPASALTPLAVREEPLRGLNATMKSKEPEKSMAVLQVVESAQLAAGDSVLVLMGKVLVREASSVPHSCNELGYFDVQRELFGAAKAAGDFAELARRYAITIASGGWAWRNALEAEHLTVSVTWGDGAERQTVMFADLLPADGDMFDITAPAYSDHADALTKLAAALEQALTQGGARGINFAVRADITMGIGARVYPSQEWASAEMQKQSKEKWPGGEGVTRTLAKLRMPDGSLQAIINDRKVGNALRLIDTWYPNAPANTPIAIEPYGANSHQGVAYRASGKASVFGMVGALAKGEQLKREERLYYVATCIRGGVFGGTED